MKTTLKRLKVDLHIINEYGTSKVCNNCWYNNDKKAFVMDKYDHRYRPADYPYRDKNFVTFEKKNPEIPIMRDFYGYQRTYFKVVGCKFNCGTIVNRDVNASKNITQLMQINKDKRPWVFKPKPKPPAAAAASATA